MNYPHIVSVSGPSLSGKSELVSRLKDLGAIELVSHTTRPKRGSEIEGVHYNFVTPEEYKILKDNNQFVQVSDLNGYQYGMSVDAINKYVDKNVPLLWVIQPKSIPQIEKNLEDKPNWNLTKVLVFNEPKVLVVRLLDRFKNDDNADSENYAGRFLSLITEELPNWITPEEQKKYDKVIKNFGPENEKEVLLELIGNKSPLYTTHSEFCDHAMNLIANQTKKLHKKM